MSRLAQHPRSTPSSADGKNLPENLFVGRHPIYEPNIQVCAYKLTAQTRSAGTTVNGATPRSLQSAFSRPALDQLVGDRRAYLHLEPNTVLGSHCDTLPQARVVLEVLHDVTPGQPIYGALKRLSDQGYKVALSDSGTSEGRRVAAELADVVRVDIRKHDLESLRQRVAELRSGDVQLLAERVDTYEDFDRCREAGFDLFEGYFFCTPKHRSKNIPLNKLATVQLLAKLQNPLIEMKEIEESIRTDVPLTYKLLRFANSAYVSLARQVESINHAVKLIGLERIRLWASIIMFASMEDKPRELMVTSVVRAKMTESLGGTLPNGRKDMFFSVGLLSSLDALLDCSMDVAVAQLPLVDEVKAALVAHEGVLGSALSAALAYERGDWDNVAFGGLTPDAFRGHYVEAVTWSSQLIEGLML